MHKSLTFFILIVFSNISLAGSATPSGKILQTYTHGYWTMVKIDSQSTNSYGCEKPYWYGINHEDKNYDGLLSSLLAAQMAGKTVSFWVAGCGGQGNEYPKIVSITIKS